MYSPSIPYLLNVFHVGYAPIAYTMTAYLLGYAISMLCMGGVSDQLGRKKSYLIVTGIFSISSLLLMTTSSITVFTLLRLLQGLGGGGCAVIARTSVRDTREGKDLVKGMSYISIAFYASMGIFQYLGGLIQVYGNYKMDFLFMCLFSLCVLLSVIFLFEETHHQNNRSVSLRQFMTDYANIIREKRLVILALGGGIGYAILLAFNIMGAFYLQKCLHVSPETIGEIGIYCAACYVFGGTLTNYLVKHWEIDLLIKIGKIILLIAGIASLATSMLTTQTIVLIVSPIMVGIIGQAILYPCAMIRAIEPHRQTAGAASSLFGFTQQLSGFIVTLVIGCLPYQPIAWFGGVIFSIVCISFLLLKPSLLMEQCENTRCQTT